MQRENKWQDIENLLSGELDVLENAISDENRTLAICSREEIWKLIYRLIDRAVAEERKNIFQDMKEKMNSWYGRSEAMIDDYINLIK